MRKSCLLIVFLLLISLVSALQPAPETFTFGYQPNWETYQNQIQLSWEYQAPANFEVTGFELNRNGWTAVQAIEASTYGYYEDADIIIGNEYTYTLRVLLESTLDSSLETTGYANLQVDTDEISDLLTAPTNLSLGSDLDWEGNKLPVIFWDYQLPSNYWVEQFLILRSDQDYPEMGMAYESPWSYTDYNTEANQTYHYTVKAMIANHDIQYSLVTEYSLSFEVDTSALPLSNITHNGNSSGEYNDMYPLELSSPDAGVSIYYTLDGSQPTTADNLYSSAITIPWGSETTLKARAFLSGETPSTILSLTYNITGTPYYIKPLDDTSNMNPKLFKLSWSNLSSASDYYLTMGTSPGASDILNNITVEGASSGYNDSSSLVYTPNVELVRGMQYYWTLATKQVETNIIISNPEQSFTTAEDIPINSFPYSQGFEATAGGKIPLAWTDINEGYYSYVWSVVENKAYTGNNSIKLYLSGLNDWLFSAPIQMRAGMEYDFTINASSYNYTNYNFYLTSDTALPSEDNANIVAELGYFGTNSSWHSHSTMFESDQDQIVYFAIKPTSTNYSDLWFDDFTITETALPLLAPVVNFEDSVWQNNPFSLELTHSQPNAELYYYLVSEYDRPYDYVTNFASDKILYTNPVEVNLEGENRLYVQASATGIESSPIEGYNLAIKGFLATPFFSMPAGTYNQALSIELLSEIEGVTSYYTLDGSDPITSTSKILYDGETPIEIAMPQTVTIKAYAEKENYMNSEIVTATYVTIPKLDVVTFSPEPATYSSAQQITLSNQEGASIYYTLGEEIPSETSTLYTEPISLAEGTETLIKAIAYQSGYETSDLAEAFYTITGQVASPTANIEAGIYPTPLSISLASTTSDAQIVYTLDGSQPTSQSSLYNGQPIEIGNFTSLTLKAMAFKEAWANSEVMLADYEVTGKLQEVVFSHDSGDYQGSLNINLSVPDYPTASIYYTTNNTLPNSESNLYVDEISLNSPSEVTIQAIAVLENYLNSDPVSKSYQVRNKVARPSFSLAEGNYTSPEEVEITSSTSASAIYYTLDGSDPTTGLLYTEAIELDYNTNYSFRAIASKNGWYSSEEAVANYQITGSVDTPEIDTNSGIYYEAITVSVIDIMEGADIHYTLDGSKPTLASEIYTEAFVFNPGDDIVLKITGFKENWSESKTISRWYTLPDQTYISDLNLSSYTITPEDNPEFNYAILTNQTTANLTSIITIWNAANEEVASDTNIDIVFSGITNSFSRQVAPLARGFAEGTYFYKLEVFNSDAEILDSQQPTSPFIVGTPEYTITGTENKDFGLVAAGSLNTHTFTINSTGSLALEIETDTPDSPFSVSSIPSVIASGNSTEITLTFNPLSYGSYSDQLILTTNAGEIICSLAGQSVMGQYRDDISAISATVDYGIVVNKSFTIYNDSPGAILNIDLAEDESWISLDNETAVIEAGDSLAVIVTLGEIDLAGGEYSANLIINSDDLNNAEVTIPITLTINGATIAVSDNSIEVITGSGIDVDYQFSIENEGVEPLNYNLTHDANWLALDYTNSIIANNSVEANTLHFDGTTAVGTYTTNITIQSNDVNTPELIIPVTFIVQDAIFGYLPANGLLNFGNVAVGSSKSREVTLKNTGNVPLTINSVISANPAFTLNPILEDLVLAGNTQQIVEVIFTPTATIFYNDIDLAITYSDDDDNEIITNFVMQGTGENTNPEFTLNWVNNRYSFGNVESGSTETTSLIISNTGNTDLNFTNFEFEDAIQTSVDDSDFTVMVGQSHTIQVAFSPITIGEYSLDITLNTVELATQTASLEAYVFQNSNASILSYPEEEPYASITGVNPTTAIVGTTFEFRVLYTDIDNEAPTSGYPLFLLDLNHDGDTNDGNDMVLEMTAVEANDVTYSDGKLYNCFVEVPYGYNPYYKFEAYDAGFKASTGEATSWKQGPAVVEQGLDLGLYASHIEFDNYHPEIGEEVHVTAYIQNWGGMPAENVPVTFLLDEVSFDVMIIDYIAGNSFATLETSVIPLEEGFIPVKVHVNRNDANASLAENNTLNNFASRPLVVGDVEVPGYMEVTAATSPSEIWENSDSYFTIYGSADYVDVLDPNLDVSGSFVRLTFRETGQIYTTHTNSWGDYSISILAPSAAALYNIDVYVTDYTLEGTASTSLNVKPHISNDLKIKVVQNIYQYPQINPPTDDTFTITAFVENIGTVDITNDITVNINEGFSGMAGANLTSWVITGGLAAKANQTLTFEHPGVAEVGPYYYYAEALHDDMASEDQLNNNYWNANTYIYPDLPDLTSEEINFFDLPINRQHAVVERAFKGRTKIRNNLSATSSIATATVDYRGPATSNEWAYLSTFDIPELSARQYTWLDFDTDIVIPSGQAGFYGFRVTIDLPNDLVEDDETNNVITKSIEVKNPDWDFRVKENSIKISNYDPTFGSEQVNFTASIENTGTDSAENLKVKFEYAPYRNEVITGPWQQIGNLINIAEIDFEATVNNVTSDAWTVPDSDGYLLRVVVDPNNEFPENNKYDNSREKWLGYDLFPWGHYKSTRTAVDAELSFSRYIKNRASWKADNVRVVYYDWFPHEPFTVGVDPVEIGTTQVVNISGNEGTAIAATSHTWTETGTHYITCHADITDSETAFDFAGDYDNEISENNNVDIFTVYVYPVLPDLVSWSEYINPELLNPDENEAITIQSSFENQGDLDIDDNFKVKFYVDSVQLGEELVVNGLAKKENGAIQASATFSSPTAGAHVIRVELDTDDLVVESNEDNNFASRVLVVGPAPNMIFARAYNNIAENAVELSDSSPELGQAVTITASITNDGRHLGAGWVDFYHVIANDSTLIASREFSADIHETDQVTVNWTATSEFGSIVSVIRDVTPMEYNDLDNSTEVEFGPTLQFVASFSNTQITEDEGSQLIGNLNSIIENRDNSQVIFFATANVEGTEVTLDQDYQLWVNPPADYYGTIIVNVEALNIYDDRIEADFSIIVNNVNDLPVMNLPESIALDNDATTTEDFLPYLSDVDDAEVTLTIAVEENDNVAVAIRGTEVDFTPTESFEGETTIFFTVTDGHSSTLVSDSMQIFVADNNETVEEADELDLTQTDFVRLLANNDIDYYRFIGNPDLKYFELTVLKDESLDINVYHSNWEDGSDLNLNNPDYQARNNEKLEINVGTAGYWFVRVTENAPAKASKSLSLSSNSSRSRISNEYTMILKTLTTPKNIVTSRNGDECIISWDIVTAAKSYKIYRVEYLDEGWGQAYSIVDTNSFVDENTDYNQITNASHKAVYFYKIVASTEEAIPSRRIKTNRNTQVGNINSNLK